jgi:biotin transport system substrate-specific component
MTLQMLVVLSSGFVLPPTWAGVSMGAYVLGGAMGLPLFAPDSAGVLGPTGGYLLAFPVASWLVALTARTKELTFATALIAAVWGSAAVFVVGMVWLAVWVGGWPTAVGLGLIPFLPKAMIEVSLAAILAVRLRRLREQTLEC